MSGTNRRIGRIVAVSMVVALASGCAGGPSDPPAADAGRGTGAGSATRSPATGGVWLAALRVEGDPDALDHDTQALKDVLGDALVVSPASCFSGLPADVGASAYVLGIQTATQPELDALVEASGRRPQFEARVTSVCND